MSEKTKLNSELSPLIAEMFSPEIAGVEHLHRQMGAMGLQELRQKDLLERIDITSGFYEDVPTLLLPESEPNSELATFVFMPVTEPWDSPYSRILSKYLQVANDGSSILTFFENLKYRNPTDRPKKLVDKNLALIHDDHLSPGDRMEKMFYDDSRNNRLENGSKNHDEDHLGALKRFAAPYAAAILDYCDQNGIKMIDIVGVQSGAAIAAEVARRLNPAEYDIDEHSPTVYSLFLVEPPNVAYGPDTARSQYEIQNTMLPTEILRRKRQLLRHSGPRVLREQYDQYRAPFGLPSFASATSRRANREHKKKLYEHDHGELLQAIANDSLHEQLRDMHPDVFTLIYRGEQSDVSFPLDQEYLRRSVPSQVHLVEKESAKGEVSLDVLSIAKLAVYAFWRGQRDFR